MMLSVFLGKMIHRLSLQFEQHASEHSTEEEKVKTTTKFTYGTMPYSLIMETQSVSETSHFYSKLTWSITQDFITFIIAKASSHTRKKFSCTCPPRPTSNRTAHSIYKFVNFLCPTHPYLHSPWLTLVVLNLLNRGLSLVPPLCQILRMFHWQ